MVELADSLWFQQVKLESLQLVFPYKLENICIVPGNVTVVGVVAGDTVTLKQGENEEASRRMGGRVFLLL